MRFLFAAALLVAPLAGYAQTLAAEFTFANGFSSTVGSATLVPQGGQLVDGYYSFGANQGLVLSNLSFNASHYTIEMHLLFSDVQSWRKLVDFKVLGVDAGVYSSPSRGLDFFPISQSSTVDFSAFVPVHVVISRSSVTGEVVGYVDGTARFSFIDTNGDAVFSGANREIYFFIDDFATSQLEAAPGAVNLIRIFDGPIPATNVLTLFQSAPPLPIPEPGTGALLGLGVIGLVGAARWRRAGRR
jgi:hypothetical protein